MRLRVPWLVFCLLPLLLAGCLRSGTGPASSFRPPATLATPTATLPPAALAPTSPPACTDVLSFLDDISFQDGTVVEPGAEIDKRWQVKNSGTCDWGDGYTLRLTSGDAMNTPDTLTLSPASAGSVTVLQVVLTAPAKPDQYRTSWRAYNPAGQPFGDPVYIDIIVK